jgi:hypothetical protein
LLDQSIAVLVPLLVLADLADLGRREAVELLGDLPDVELVVAQDREPAVSPGLDKPQPLPVVGERGVDQGYIGLDGFLDEGPERVARNLP